MSNVSNSHMNKVQGFSMQIPRFQGGFTLIEILVAIVVLSIGLLGVASLQVQGLKNNQSAYLRTQASMLAYDMADRMRANPDEVDSYVGFNSKGVVPPDPQCIANESGCNELNRALTDLFEWAERLNGTEEAAILLPDAQGTITAGDDDAYIIKVSWNETDWDEDTQSKQIFTHSYSVNFVLWEQDENNDDD